MIKAILLDIEGTTTPIDFVHKVLFPFAKANISTFVRENADKIKPEFDQLRDEHGEDHANGKYLKSFDVNDPGSVSDYLEFLIDADRKSTPLKSIQGKIWQAGYEAGELVSEVYEDVPKAFARWRSDGKTIAIYSSGSVLAQKLIFKHSNHGDLTLEIDRYFDTRIGHKREAESYRKISAELELAPNEILFISDIAAELDAANETGMATMIICRDEKIAKAEPHRQIQNFSEISI